MPETVTIQLEDGQPFTATPDSDRWIVMQGGMQPAEPWWSECEANWVGEGEEIQNPLPRDALPCASWGWNKDCWYCLRPTGGRSWSDIAPKQPAEPQYEKHITPNAEVARLTAERDRDALAAEVWAHRFGETCSVAALPIAAARINSARKATDASGALDRAAKGGA